VAAVPVMAVAGPPGVAGGEMDSPPTTAGNLAESSETTSLCVTQRACTATLYVPGADQEWNELVTPCGVQPEWEPSPQSNEY